MKFLCFGQTADWHERVKCVTIKVMNAPCVVPSMRAVVYLSGRLMYLETNTDFCLCVQAFVRSALALGDS